MENTDLISKQLINLLLEKAHVAVLGGNCFGNYGKGDIRLYYASTSIDTIERAVEQSRKTIQEECFHNQRITEVKK